MSRLLSEMVSAEAGTRTPGRQPAGNAVVCVCGGFGFPNGGGTTARIRAVGKCLQEAGAGFRVLHCGPSPVAANTERSGVHEGVPFEYTTILSRPANPLVRALVYAHALAGVTARLIRMRRMRGQTAVWLYMNGGFALLYATGLCRLLGLPVIQEYGEWWPAHSCTSALGRWAYRKPLIKHSSGALAISTAIEERLRELAAKVNPRFLVYRLPALVDMQRFDTGPETRTRENAFVWCGTEQWVADVLFLVDALTEVNRRGYSASITVVGKFRDTFRQIVRDRASANGLSDRDLVFTGFVDDDTLSQHYRGALALLLPMPDDDGSLTRMPNKLGEYLASGRPVITRAVGELQTLLSHGVNAYLARSGDASAFAEQMIAVLREPAKARLVGNAGQNTCRKHLDYRSHSNDLAEWVSRCIAYGGSR